MKKIIVLLLLLIFVVVLLCTFPSCKNGVESTGSQSRDIYYPENVFKKSDIAFPEGMKVSRASLLAPVKGYRFLCSKYAGGKSSFYICSVEPGGTDIETASLETINERAEIKLAAYDTEGGLYTYETAAAEGRYYLNRFDVEGALLFSILLSEINISGPLNSLIAADGGAAYIATEALIVKISGEGRVLSQIKPRSNNERIDNIGLVGGVVYAGVTDKDNNTPLCLYAEDGAEKFSGEATVTGNFRAKFFCGPGHDIYYYDDFSLYGYNFGGRESVIVSFSDSCIADAVLGVSVMDSDNVAYLYLDLNTSVFHAAALTRVPGDQLEPQEVIELACIQTNPYININIAGFNRENGQYHVVCKNYTGTEDMSPDGQFSLDIAAGRIPDVILSGGNYSLENYAGKGLLCDLYEFMEGGAEPGRDDLLSCVKTPFELDGKLFRLVTGFTIKTLVGKEKNIGKYEHWTLSEMLDYEKGLSEGVSLFGNLPRSMVTAILFETGLDAFIDYENASCTFDSGSFITLLEYLKALPENTQAEDYESYRNDTAMIYWPMFVSGIDDYISIMGNLGFEKVNLIGYPVAAGGGTVIVAQSEYGITKTSPVKDGAWEFLKYLLRDECLYNGGMDLPAFPVTASAMEKYISDYYQYAFAYDNTGTLICYSSPENAEKFKTPGQTIYMLKEEDLRPLLTALNNADKTSADAKRTSVRTMVFEELNIFFNGGKTAKETAEIIQNRVSIYLNEKT